MFKRGNGRVGQTQVASPQTLYHRLSHFATQERVLAQRFLDTGPAGLTCQVKHWAVADVSALRPNLLTDDLARLLHHITGPCRCHAKSSRENGCSNGHMAMWRFLGKKDGNAQPCLFDGITLHGIRRLCRQCGVQAVSDGLSGPGIGPEHGPVHAHVQAVHLSAEFLAHGHFLAVDLVGIPSHEAHNLPGFFLKGHALEQVLNALLNR